MTPEEFLEQWKKDNIDSGTQPAEAEALMAKLLADAAREDISHDILELAAGGSLDDFLAGSIRAAVEERLW